MGLDSVELVMAVEEEFGISISDADAQKMLTPKEVINFVESRRGLVSLPQPKGNPSRTEIAKTVKRLVIEQLGIPEAVYGEDKEFVRDLGMK